MTSIKDTTKGSLYGQPSTPYSILLAVAVGGKARGFTTDGHLIRFALEEANTMPTPDPSGLPPSRYGEGKRRYSVRLTAQQYATALRIGHGNLTRGVRVALARHTYGHYRGHTHGHYPQDGE